MSGEADFKRGKRHVDPDLFKKVHLSARGCELAIYGGCAKGQRLSAHHVLPKGSPYFGDDTKWNLVMVCGSGTTGHHGLIEAGDEPTLAALGRRLVMSRRDTIAYIEGKLGVVAGRDWLLRHLRVEVK